MLAIRSAYMMKLTGRLCCCRAVGAQSLIYNRSLTTTMVTRSKDPVEDFLNQLQTFEKPEKEIKVCSKMLTQEPPISILDIDGNPVEPIDINAWADPEELQELFGNIDFLNKKVIYRDIEELAMNPLNLVTSIITNEISVIKMDEQEQEKEENGKGGSEKKDSNDKFDELFNKTEK